MSVAGVTRNKGYSLSAYKGLSLKAKIDQELLNKFKENSFANPQDLNNTEFKTSSHDSEPLGVEFNIDKNFNKPLAEEQKKSLEKISINKSGEQLSDNLTVRANSYGGKITYQDKDFFIGTSLKKENKATTNLNAQYKKFFDNGAEFDIGFRRKSGGITDGTIYTRAGLQSKPLNTGESGFEVGGVAGYVSQPNIRGKLYENAVSGTAAKGMDSLNRKTQDTDYSLKGIVLGVNGGGQLSLNITPELNTYAKLSTHIRPFIPVDTDPVVTKLNSDGLNGATSIDIGSLAGLSSLEVRVDTGFSYKMENAVLGLNLSANPGIMDDPTFAVKSDNFIDNYAFTEKSADAVLASRDGKFQSYLHLPLQTTTGDVPVAGLTYKWDGGNAGLKAVLTKDPVLSADLTTKITPESTLIVSGYAGKNESQIGMAFTSGFVVNNFVEEYNNRHVHTKPEPLKPLATINTIKNDPNTLLPKDLKKQSLSDVMKTLNTPEKVSAFINVSTASGSSLEYKAHNDDWSKYKPSETLSKGGGICADIHLLAAAALKQNGYEAYTAQIYARSTAHDITVFQNKSGTWDIMQYGEIYETNGNSPEHALLNTFPDSIKIMEINPVKMAPERTHVNPVGKETNEFFREGENIVN